MLSLGSHWSMVSTLRADFNCQKRLRQKYALQPVGDAVELFPYPRLAECAWHDTEFLLGLRLMKMLHQNTQPEVNLVDVPEVVLDLADWTKNKISIPVRVNEGFQKNSAEAVKHEYLLLLGCGLLKLYIR